ncbi:uncharacterized protein AKAME5_001533600 [Lates japonicus]|uniref:Uncharacterized protein n=1 Tax=Lates japonicus TaxID=270547 RepID=A0AAD3N1V0_LATJO|nr:uncharacterized protein AKAME5_001533600 [Lates japonicus]
MDTSGLSAPSWPLCRLFFILSGLSLVVGLVLYISSINDEVMNRPREPEQFFNYYYGWSFAFAASSFLLKEGAGVMSVYLFMKRYAEEEMYRPHPALYRPRLSDSSDYSGQFLHPESSWPPPKRGRSTSEASSDISIQLNQAPPAPTKSSLQVGGQGSPPSGSSSAGSYQMPPQSAGYPSTHTLPSTFFTDEEKKDFKIESKDRNSPSGMVCEKGIQILLTTVGAFAAFGLMTVAIGTDYWLYSRALICNSTANVTQDDPHNKDKKDPGALTHSGLWRICCLEGVKRGVCSQINHFPEDADFDHDGAEYVLRVVRASNIFPILSAILLLMGGMCIAASRFYKSKRNIILGAGILFVAAGMCIWDPHGGRGIAAFQTHKCPYRLISTLGDISRCPRTLKLEYPMPNSAGNQSSPFSWWARKQGWGLWMSQRDCESNSFQ